jgi:hypothetical protein
LPPPVSWHDYVSRLPIWACDLLSDITFSVPLDLCLSILQTPSSILLASDGGACPHRASFGSLLATDDQILVTTGGRAFGDDPRSFRAEGYGMLATLLLLQRHLHMYFQIPMVVSSLSHYTDSESLIKRLEKSRTLCYPYPRHNLYSEVDLELQILSLLASFPVSVTFHHVHSHQDDDIPEDELPWPVQLNIQCDRIATPVLQTAEHRLPTVARQLPSARNQAASTVKMIVAHFHSFTHELWLLRNSHLHGPCSSHTPFKHLHLLAQIAELYDVKPHMLPSDRDLILDEPFEMIRSLPTNGLKLFYYYTKPLVERSVQQASVFGPNFRRIDDYFSPRIPLELYNVICLDVHPPHSPVPPPLAPTTAPP